MWLPLILEKKSSEQQYAQNYSLPADFGSYHPRIDLILTSLQTMNSRKKILDPFTKSKQFKEKIEASNSPLSMSFLQSQLLLKTVLLNHYKTSLQQQKC